MIGDVSTDLVRISTRSPIWERFFTVAPLVLVGTVDEDGSHDLAPKHMVTPLGWGNYIGFVCTPRHHTYQNIRREGVFTVSYPRPSQLVLTSLAAAPRCDERSKPSLLALPTVPAFRVPGVLMRDAYLCLECEVHGIWDEFGECSLISGEIVEARVSEDALRTSGLDDGELLDRAPLLAYVAPGRYRVIERSSAFPFPKDFVR